MNAVDQMTQDWLTQAGLLSGQHVIDIGCGPGLVTEMILDRVGPNGRVYAIDRDEGMLGLAKTRLTASERSDQVQFICGGFDCPDIKPSSIDAVIGRRVLKYQPAPLQALQWLLPNLKPGGLVLFHEHDTLTVEHPRYNLPLHDKVRGWLHGMLQHEHVQPHMGFDLDTVFSAAGLQNITVQARANLLTPDSTYPIAHIVKAVLPRLSRYGILTSEEEDLDTLDERLRAERRAHKATVVWELVFCAWGYKPDH